MGAAVAVVAVEANETVPLHIALTCKGRGHNRFVVENC